MPSVNIASTYSGVVRASDENRKTSGLDWTNNIRNASTGDQVINHTSSTTVGYGNYLAANLSSMVYLVLNRRGYHFFDVTFYATAYIITAATLNMRVTQTSSSSVIVCKSTAWGSDGSTSTLGLSDYGTADLSTPYSSAVTWNSVNSYTTFTLNSTAISDLNTNGYLNIVMVDYAYDYSNVAPNAETGVIISNYGYVKNSTYPFYLGLTYMNQGYAHKVAGRPSVSKVSDIASIANIIGV